jgi:competence protein ComEC
VPAVAGAGVADQPQRPLANLLAVPWISLLVLPPALLGTLYCRCLSWVRLVVAGRWLIDGLFTAWRGSPGWYGMGADRSGAGFWCSSLWAPCCCCCRGAVSPAGLAVAVAGCVSAANAGARWTGGIWQLDVGQGLALILRTRHHTLLYDAGPRSAFDLGRAGGAAVVAKLGWTFDLMLLSHADADHAGGALAVARAADDARGGETGDCRRLAISAPSLRQR